MELPISKLPIADYKASLKTKRQSALTVGNEKVPRQTTRDFKFV